MVVSYTNNYGYVDPYANNQHVNNMTTNADGGGNGGGGAFLKMFEEKEAEETKRDTSVSSNPLDDLYPNTSYYASEHVLKDYIDNSLLINAEQVACTNITQHLALKNNVKETLKFLNVQAAKTMVNSKKRNYKFVTENKSQETFQVKQNMTNPVGSAGANFFEAKLNNPHVNFFMTNQ